MTENYIKLKYGSVVYETVVDGIGFRVALYLSGCRHNCHHCHNKEGQNPNNGIDVTYQLLDQIITYCHNNEHIAGVTLSGGDPFYNPQQLYKIVKYLKKHDINIWCYTGYQIKDLVSNYDSLEVLKQLDVIVDGKYIENLRNPNLAFRGSDNQRIIEIKKDLSKYLH